MATHSSILAWDIPQTEEPRGLRSPWGRGELDMTGPQNYHHSKFLQLVSSFVSYLVFTHGVWLPVRQCDIHPIPVLMILASLFPAALPERVCACVCARQQWSGDESMYTRSCQRTSRPRPDSTRSSLHRINLIYTQRGNLPIKHTHLRKSVSTVHRVPSSVSVLQNMLCFRSEEES